jgi:hypothetical protein
MLTEFYPKHLPLGMPRIKERNIKMNHEEIA